MMESGNVSTLPSGFHHLKDSAGILGTKGLFPRRVCTTHREDRKRWVTSQDYRTRTAPHEGSTSFYKTVSALVCHDWHLGLAKSQL